MKQLRRLGRLVALQVSNQMPCRGQIVGAYALYFPLLHAVFAKVPYTGLKSFVDRDCRMGLRDADESDVFGAPPRTIRGIVNPLLDLKQGLSNRGWRHVQIRIVTWRRCSAEPQQLDCSQATDGLGCHLNEAEVKPQVNKRTLGRLIAFEG